MRKPSGSRQPYGPAGKTATAGPSVFNGPRNSPHFCCSSSVSSIIDLGDNQVSRLDSFREGTEAETPRFEGADQVHVALAGDLVVHANRPVASVDKQPAQALAFNVL